MKRYLDTSTSGFPRQWQASASCPWVEIDSDEVPNLSEISALVREMRNDLLSSTDWWAGSDHTMTEAQIAYRQDLRNLPDQTDFPVVNWPTKPE